MSEFRLISPEVANVPWQDKPGNLTGAPVWRYSENPIVGRNPVEGVARIFNSAVIPYEGAFIGVFRGEQVNESHTFIWEEARMEFTGILIKIRFSLWMKMENHLCQFMHMIHVW